MTRSFVDKDLHDQSFRGQDMTGVDFTGADLRGCDFRDAILINANFTAVQTGMSQKQLVISNLSLISGVFIGIIIFFIAISTSSENWVAVVDKYVFETTVSFVASIDNSKSQSLGSLLNFKDLDKFTRQIGKSSIQFIFVFAIPSFVVLIGVGASKMGSYITTIYEQKNKSGDSGTDDNNFMLAFVGITASAISILGVFVSFQAYNPFFKDNWMISVGAIYTCIALLLLSCGILVGVIDAIKVQIGTQFQNANLTCTRFTGAKLNATDFSNSICDYVDWQGIKLENCILPDILHKKSVLPFYTNLQAGRNQNFTNTNFEHSYLVDADLVDANLQNANLNGADLRGAKLTNANLKDVQALGTNFSGAMLTGSVIASWGINSNTNFENVICKYVYIDEARQERKPASGDFEEGDFALLVGIFSNTLDFFFKHEINFPAFQYAMQRMLNQHPNAKIIDKQILFLGKDNDNLLRSYDVLNPSIDKSKLHQDFAESYDVGKRLYPEDNQLIEALSLKVMNLETENTTLKAIAAVKDNWITSLDKIATLQAIKSNDKIIIGNVVGDPMSDQNIKFQSGGDITGVNVASGNIDISGTVTITIQKLHDSNIPEAPKLAELLTQLQTVIGASPDLAYKDKQKVLKYLDNIGEVANKQDGDRNRIDELIDNILGVVSKAAVLLTPVQAIADSLRKLLQL
jgi:uncharacterized protein YjbI with pentapeptide repeats